jgi:hypothetical protein
VVVAVAGPATRVEGTAAVSVVAVLEAAGDSAEAVVVSEAAARPVAGKFIC